MRINNNSDIKPINFSLSYLPKIADLFAVCNPISLTLNSAYFHSISFAGTIDKAYKETQVYT